MRSFFEHTTATEFDDTDVKKLIANSNVLSKSYEILGKYNFSGKSIRFISPEPEWFIQPLEQAIYDLTGGSDLRIGSGDNGFRIIEVTNRGDESGIELDTQNGVLKIEIGSKEDLGKVGFMIDREYAERNLDNLTWVRISHDSESVSDEEVDSLYSDLADLVIDAVIDFVAEGDSLMKDKKYYIGILLDGFTTFYKIMLPDIKRWETSPLLDNKHKEELLLMSRSKKRFI